MLDNIKLLLGKTDEEDDNLLKLLIQQATDEAKEYTHREDVCELESIIEKMVVYNFNRLGTEGLNSESYSGVNYSYISDYPENIMRVLKKKRKLIVL